VTFGKIFEKPWKHVSPYLEADVWNSNWSLDFVGFALVVQYPTQVRDEEDAGTDCIDGPDDAQPEAVAIVEVSDALVLMLPDVSDIGEVRIV
jgi:hypothetical protein